MTAKISTQKKAELVKRALSGESVSSLSREAGVSRVIFYRWISRYKENGEKGLTEGARGRPAKKKAAVLKKEYTKLSSSARLNMVKEVVEQEQEASEVAERYGISRTTLYKWIKRYEEDVRNGKIPELSSRVPFVEHYYRETPEKYQEAVLSMVARHPEYGIRSIVANLPKVGTTPIVGHHGVQNILRRNGLLHFEQRLAYAKGKETSITYSIGKVLETVLTFFRIKPETRAKIIESSSTIFLIAFGIMVGLGATAFLAGNIFAPTGVSRVGLVFAGLALIMGSIFFLYSLKYYLTLALVLSYSQKSSLSKNRGGGGEDGIFSKILGQARSNDFGYGRQSAGLEPDLSHVTLARNPYVSVHIPFYNEKNVVRRSIEAAVNFKYPEYEVILCDDSTDSTTDIIREYMKLYLAKGERLKQVVNEKEGWTLSSVEIKPGVTLKHLHRTTRSGYKGKALALALTLTDPRTEFISIFDADFVPYPDTLELFLKYFKVGNNMNENCGGKYCCDNSRRWFSYCLSAESLSLSSEPYR